MNLQEKLIKSHRFHRKDTANASKISHAIRCHWHVENSLHWVMDVTFKEDDSKIRRGVAAENMSVMRQLALNLIRKESVLKFSIPRK